MCLTAYKVLCTLQFYEKVDLFFLYVGNHIVVNFREKIIMILTSKLFRDNAALESCARNHAAHITRGATGDHVAKIQYAISALDGLRIDRTELENL